MKIAIIGTTPIMVIKALLLSKFHDITVFEASSKFGGAWSFNKYKNVEYPEKTNIIVPDNKSEEKYIVKMKKYLSSKFNLKIKKNKKRYHNITLYKPNEVFIFDIKKLFILLRRSKKIIVKKLFVKSLKVQNQKVTINSKYLFDKVYIPYFINLDKVLINNKKFHFPFKKIENKHLHFITKKKFSDEFYYWENYNEYLDRAQLLKYGNYYFFSARIRKNFKHLSAGKIFKLSNFKIQANKVYNLRLISYNHHFRDKLQIANLKNIEKFKEIKLIDTRQFVGAFKKLKLV
jgi:hypothetical protein